MAAAAPADTAELLRAWRAGDDEAREQLFHLFYPWLMQAAAGLLRNERAVSLSSGDLVHEAVIRLIQLERIQWQDSVHFMALTSKFMRRVLVDHVRAKGAGKRDHQRVLLTTRLEPRRPLDLQRLDEALLRLAAIDPDKAEIVEMRYFGGMSLADVAQVTGVSERTVKRRWLAARLWLMDAMEKPL